jgi:hypothetical protein
MKFIRSILFSFRSKRFFLGGVFWGMFLVLVLIREVRQDLPVQMDDPQLASHQGVEPSHPSEQLAENTFVSAEDKEDDSLSPAAQTEASGHILMFPEQTKGQVFTGSNLSELSKTLPKNHRVAWEAFKREFPETDPTEVQKFHQAVSLKRAQFGYKLNDQSRVVWQEWIESAESMANAMVQLRAAELGLAVSGVNGQGRGFWLAGFEEGAPYYVWTTNVQAAITTRANTMRLNPLFDPELDEEISGQGLYVNVNDNGTIYEHPEFQLPDAAGSRIVYTEINDSGDRGHMTHVAGTVGAWGYNSNLQGMAPRVWFRSHIQQNIADISMHGMSYSGEMFSDLNPVTGELEMRSVMGTTSLGASDTREKRGLYSYTAQSFDQALWDHPYYIHFYSAGNEGSGFSTLSLDQTIAKNTLTIASVSQINRDGQGNYSSGGNVSSFSSRGPTYDGRIKPDFAANGESLLSTNSATGQGTRSGTSMATPNASGSTVLLIDYIRRKLPGHFLRSSTLRALLMTSALDRGYSGPDYRYGWGVIDVAKASEIIKFYAENPSSRVVVEDDLANGDTWTFDYVYDGTGPIIVSLAWLDAPGQAQLLASPSTLTRDPRLVNDLDLRVIGPDGTHNPWVHPFTVGQGPTPAFDDSLRDQPAVTGDNVTDPVEQVYISNPVAGVYQIQVNHKGTLNFNFPQTFSLAVQGISATAPLAPSIASVSPSVGSSSSEIPIMVTGSGFVVGTDIILRKDGESEVQAKNLVVKAGTMEGRFDGSAMTPGYWHVIVRSPDGTEVMMENAYLLPQSGERVTLFFDDFESGTGEWFLSPGWAFAVPDKEALGGPAVAFQGNKALVSYPSATYPAYTISYANFPVLNTTGYRDLQLEFRRWVGFAQSGTSPGVYGTVFFSTGAYQYETLTRYHNIDDDQWEEVSMSLPAGMENQTELYLRFYMNTQNAPPSYGWNIDEVRLTGVNTPILYPPVFQTYPSQLTGEENEAYSYSIVTMDSDTASEDLGLTAAGLPAGLTFTDLGNGTGTLSGTLSSPGIYEVNLSVTDGSYITSQVFTLQIYPEGGPVLPPAAPSSLSLGNLSHNEVPLLWDDNADNELGFKVYRAPNLSGPWIEIADLPADSATYTDGSVVSENSYVYRVSAWNYGGESSLSNTVSATIPEGPAAPVITEQPQTLTAFSGQMVTLHVTATGSPAPGYQWRKGGVDISGATSASYTIPSALPADAGTYDVVVSNTLGSVTSTGAILTVTATLPLHLEEMFDFGSANSASGYGDWQDSTNVINYIGSSNGNGSFTHSSYDNAVNIGGYLGIGGFSGLRGGQLTFTTIAPTGTFWMSALVYKSSVSDTSITFLSLHDSTQNYGYDKPVGAGFGLSGDGTNLRPVYRAANGTFVEGPAAGYAIDTFHLVIAKVTVGPGNDSISLWVKKAADSFSTTEDSLGVAALTVNDADFGDALKHLWVGQQNNGSGRVDAIRISSLNGNGGLAQVLGQQSAPVPIITTQPQSQTVYATQSATLSVTATGENLSYQWFKGVNELGGETGASLVINPVAESNAGDYHVVVSNPGGSVTSAEATLTVHPEDYSSNPANVPDLWAQSYYGVGGEIPLTVLKGGAQVPLHTVYMWGLDPTDPNQVFEVINLQVNGSGMQLNGINTVATRRYRLQYSDDLTDPNSWTPMGDEVIGNGGILNFSDPTPSDNRAYRVHVQP